MPLCVTVECVCSLGALNAIVFGLDKDTRSRLTFSQIKVRSLTCTTAHTVGDQGSIVVSLNP